MAMPARTVTGEVSRVRDHGFQITGDEEHWYTLSPLVEGLTLPERGDWVAVSVDGDGNASSIEAMREDALSSPSSVAGGESEGRVAPPAPSGEKALARRQELLQLAVSILSSGGRAVNPDDVFALAERLEAWIAH